jgi:hypothetical protein
VAPGIYPMALSWAGLWLAPAALIRGDVNAVLAIVQRGVISAEYLDFVARLAKARIA